MEPTFDVEIFASKEFSNDIINDLIGRREGKIYEVVDDKNEFNEELISTKISGVLPIRNSSNYSGILKSITKGAVDFNISPGKYICCNANINKIIN